MTDRILVFIPCYNCAPQIVRMLGQFTDAIGLHFEEILLLDNGSRDGTVDAAIGASRLAQVKRVTVGCNRANYSLGGSHKAAFAYAVRNGFSHVVVLHGDDQGSIADLLPVLDQGRHRQFDACLGARFMKNSRLVGYSRFRVFGNHVFNGLLSLAARRRVFDLGSGLNIFAESVLADPAITRFSDDLRFNVFLLLHLLDKARHVTFFPICWREDDQVSNVKMTSQALKTVTIVRDYVLRRRYFRLTDFRAVNRPAYLFDIVYTTDSVAGAVA